MRLRPACVSISAFALQLLVRERPGWRELPAAVVERDEASGTILSANRAAYEKGIRAGISYTQALSLCGELRAAVVSPEERKAAREEIMGVLCGFTPEVEPCDLDEGAFWLNAQGMGNLYPTTEAWMTAILGALGRRGFAAVVVVGFSRFASYIIARGRRSSLELATPHAEQQAMRDAPLSALPLSPPVLTLLDRLGLRRVGAFLDLPPNAVRRRFGPEAKAIFDRSDEEHLPLQPSLPYVPPRVLRRFDDPISNSSILLAELRVLVEELVEVVRARQRLIASVTLLLREANGETMTETIAPAAPTRSAPVLDTLVRLRLAEARFGAGVEGAELTAAETELVQGGAELFETDRARAGEAGARAFALIRARLGNDAVRRAVLRDDHLPERSFAWVPLDRPPTSEGRGGAAGAHSFRVVRRVLRDPVPYGGRPSIVAGPFLISGRWWADEGGRAYYFAKRGGTELVWIYREEGSGEWMVQGIVD